ncbi:MAG TPA: alpha/beta hydrolase [Kofleriaceae bacterium]
MRAAIFVFVACTPPPKVPVPHDCANRVLQVGDDTLYVDLRGDAAETIVFEAGFGNDSTVWADIRTQFPRTFVYDRAGMGKSTIGNEPYSLEHDATNLLAALDQCHVTGPIIMVGHSYGGAIALEAARDPRITAIVLLEAMVPGIDMSADIAKMKAEYDEIRRAAPALAKVAIPWAEALPDTLHALETVHPGQPIIDVIADHGQTAWRPAHERFVAAAPNRELRVVTSSHKIPHDAPGAVVDAIRASTH